jgi:hypothetical protein
VDSVDQLSQAEPVVRFRVLWLWVCLRQLGNPTKLIQGMVYWAQVPRLRCTVRKKNKKSIFDYQKVKDKLGINDQKRRGRGGEM